MQTVHDEMFTIFITFNTADIFEVDTKHIRFVTTLDRTKYLK